MTQEELFACLATNVEKLIKISVMGEIASPTIRSVYNVSAAGKPLVLPGVGGITYNLRVGDLACGWEADHVEPGVSVKTRKTMPDQDKPLTPPLTCCHVSEMKRR